MVIINGAWPLGQCPNFKKNGRRREVMADSERMIVEILLIVSMAVAMPFVFGLLFPPRRWPDDPTARERLQHLFYIFGKFVHSKVFPHSIYDIKILINHSHRDRRVRDFYWGHQLFDLMIHPENPLGQKVGGPFDDGFTLGQVIQQALLVEQALLITSGLLDSHAHQADVRELRDKLFVNGKLPLIEELLERLFAQAQAYAVAHPGGDVGQDDTQ